MGLLLALLAAAGQDDAVRKLIDQLNSDRIEVRDEASRKLEEMGKPALPLLEKAAKDQDDEVASRARDLLLRIPIREKVTDRVRSSVPGVMDRLAKGEWTGVFVDLAADVLARKEKRKFPALEAKDLERLLPPALRGAAGSAEKVAVCQAATSLRLRTGFRDAVALLRNEDGSVRSSAAQMLRRLEAREVALLVAALAGDEEPAVRLLVASTLADLKSKESLPALRGLLADPEDGVRLAAAAAVRDVEAREAVGDLVRLLKDRNPTIRSTAAHALGRLGSKDAVPHLLVLLRDESSDVRWWTVQALVELRADQAAPELRRLLEDASPEVRRAAAEALAALRSK